MARHADETDVASDLVEAERESLIARARSRINEHRIKPDGGCHWCGAEVPAPRLFCDRHCADSWEESERRNSRR